MNGDLAEPWKSMARRWEQYFLPGHDIAAADAQDDRHFARMLLWSATIAPIGLACVWVLNRATGRPLGAPEIVADLCILALVAMLPLLRMGAPVRRVGMLFIGILTAATFIPVVAYQGRDLLATFLVTMYPAIVVVVFGIRRAWLWCGLVVAGLLAVGTLAELRPDLADTLPKALEARWLFGAAAWLTVLLTILVTLLEASRRRTVAALQASRAALRDSETRLRAIFEAAPIGMGLFTTYGETLEANSRGREMLGIEPGTSVEASALLRCVHPEDEQRAYAFYERALRGVGESKLEYRWVMPDGRIEWVEASASVLRDDDGKVRYVIGAAEFVTARKEVEDQVHSLAFFDGITGLANRSLFLQRLSTAVDRSDESGNPLAVLFLDLDGFKQVNDSHGHEVGDDVLARVAERFASCVRLSDQVGRVPDELHVSRFGGDEFTVLLSEVSGPEGVEIVAKRLISSLNAPVSVNGLELQLGVSIGIALYPRDGDSVDALLRHADAAMYRVKKTISGSGFGFYEQGDEIAP